MNISRHFKIWSLQIHWKHHCSLYNNNCRNYSCKVSLQSFWNKHLTKCFTNCYFWYKGNPYEMNLQRNHLKPLSLHWFYCIWKQCDTEKMEKVQLTAEMINRRQHKGAQSNIWKRKRKLGTSNCSAS